jgi:hypothetical protein
MTLALTLDDVKEKLEELQHTCHPEDYAVLCLAWCVEEIERLQKKVEATHTLIWAIDTAANQLGVVEATEVEEGAPSELRIYCPNCKIDQVVSVRVLLGGVLLCNTPGCGYPLPNTSVRIVAKK